MNKLIYGTKVIEYEIKPSARAKRLRITISNGKVTVSLPKGVSVQEAKAFVIEKREWIFRHFEKYKALQLPKEKKSFETGENFLFLGRECQLIIETWEKNKVKVDFNGRNFLVSLPVELSEEERAKRVEEALIKWYKVEARKILKVKLEQYSELMGVTFKEFRLKEQKTRWGSCSGKGNINLNWRIIMAPTAVVDYLVIHELAHLKEMNHSQAFWKLVEKYMPEYEKWKRWLRDNGKDLRI